MRLILSLILIFSSINCSEKKSNAVQALHLEAELVSENESFRPGEPFWVGLKLDMEESWHINWVNPGDAGLAPKISWELPEGFSAGEIQWPNPQRLPIPPFMLFGYEDDVLLPVQITPPKRMKSGEKIKIAANADWVVCNEACIPGSATLNLEMEVEDDEPQKSELWAGQFESTRKKLPIENENWIFNADITDYRVYIKLNPLRNNYSPLEKMLFFPEQQGIINNAADQVLTKKGGGYELEIERDRMGTFIPNILTGVLIIESKNGEVREKIGFKLELPLNRAES
jgi:thiol:disulfide interchange protein DsbD